MRRITWNVVCWCILITFRTDKLLVTVCFFSSFWRNFDSLKQVEFGGYGHFFENTGMAWNLACWCILIIFRTKVTVCWFFFTLAAFWLSETGQIWGFRAFCKKKHGKKGLKLDMRMYLDHLLFVIFLYMFVIFVIFAPQLSAYLILWILILSLDVFSLHINLALGWLSIPVKLPQD